MIKIHSTSIELCGMYPSSKEGYYINKSRLKSKNDLVWWLNHLSEKNWFSTTLYNEFIEVYKKINGKQ